MESGKKWGLEEGKFTIRGQASNTDGICAESYLLVLKMLYIYVIV